VQLIAASDAIERLRTSLNRWATIIVCITIAGIASSGRKNASIKSRAGAARIELAVMSANPVLRPRRALSLLPAQAIHILSRFPFVIVPGE